MGLFDLFKKKTQPAAPANEPYLGDLQKTGTLYNLLQTPKNARGDQWEEAFLADVVQASFRCGDPQVIKGPDGFPYFRLFLPEPNKEFQCFVFDRMKDDFLLDAGYGVVINPGPNSADWVFSYGDILNLHLNRTFYTTTKTAFNKRSGQEVLTKDEEVLIGQPSESILPENLRKVLSEFLKANGVQSPKIALMTRKDEENDEISMDIVFNLVPEKFADQQSYESVMRAIGWFLPRHYTYVGMHEETLGKGFLPL